MRRVLVMIALCLMWLAAIGGPIRSFVNTQMHGLTGTLNQAQQAAGAR